MERVEAILNSIIKLVQALVGRIWIRLRYKKYFQSDVPVKMFVLLLMSVCSFTSSTSSEQRPNSPETENPIYGKANNGKGLNNQGPTEIRYFWQTEDGTYLV